ncbi:MAG: DUF192 domain-containing protein [Bacilli bacterium]|nr:DUF192 domain-containing protein [Bacilli bacterium]
MKLIYNNKSIDIYECKSFYSRLKGFMFTKKIDRALLFNHCNSIHTFFMKKNIDVIMCDKDNKILYYYHNLSKNKIILPKKNVYKTIELPVDYYEIKINDKVKIAM